MLHLLLLFFLNPVFFEHVHGERQWDHFVFSLEWPPTYCFIQTCKIPYSINDFNIHGLWPSIWPHTEPKNCSNRTPFRIELIKPIYNDLQKQWANLIDFDNPEDFWKHEWSKHGVCAISDHPFISNELDYFNISLAIKSRVNLLSRLESVSITPNNLVTLKRDMLLDQLKNLFSVNVLIYCSMRKHQPGRLSEIRICLNPSLEFIDCFTSSANKINHQLFSNHFYKTVYGHSVCKSLLPWLYQSPICLNQPSTILSNNVPCPEELIFPKFN